MKTIKVISRATSDPTMRQWTITRKDKTMKTKEHTPTPIKVTILPSGAFHIDNELNRPRTAKEKKELAIRIETACNAHKELLEACKEAYKHLRVCDDHENTATNHGSKAIALIEKAIAKAEGK